MDRPAVGKSSTVRVHYTGTLDDGTEFDSSRGREPLEFTMGKGMLIPGFEQAVLGLCVGESAKVTIPPAEAYGEHNPELAIRIPIKDVPPQITPKKGMALQLRQTGGQEVDAVITEVTATEVVIDVNHPLAGLSLTFDIELMEIVK